MARIKKNKNGKRASGRSVDDSSPSKKRKDKDTSVKAGKFTVKKNDDNRIVCLTNMFKGREYLNIRFQFKNDENEWCFTNKGISIPLANGLAEEFIEKFKKNF